MGTWRVQVGGIVLAVLLLGGANQVCAESEGERLEHALGLVEARLARLNPQERERVLAWAKTRLLAALPGQRMEDLETERQGLTWSLAARLAPSPPPRMTPQDPRLLAQYLQIIQIIVDRTVPVYPVCRDCPRRPVDSADWVGVVDMANRNIEKDREIRDFEANHGVVFDGVAAVQVRRVDGTQSVVGTAVAVESGHLVTSKHVVGVIGSREGAIGGMLRYVLSAADGRVVRLVFGRRDLQQLREDAGLRVVELGAKQVFAVHPRHDVAVFRVAGLAGLASFRLGQTPPTRWGLFGAGGLFGPQQDVLVVGYPSEPRGASPGELDEVYGIRRQGTNRPDTPLKILRLAPGQTSGGWCPGKVPDCLRYTANTLPGNSGSAVVSPGDAVLLAIHRSGPDEGLARVNDGVRVEHLRELLAAVP